MIGWLISAETGRRGLAIALVALTIFLCLINLRSAGARAARAAERLAIQERNDAIHKDMLDAASRRPADRDALAERLCDGEF